MLVVIGLLLGMAPPAAAGGNGAGQSGGGGNGAKSGGKDASKIEPSLLQAITKDPKKRYQVIVQGAPARTQDERKDNQRELQQQIGENDEDGNPGKVRDKLGLVNGFSAELTGKRILQLSKLPDVKSISGNHRVRIQAGTIDTTLLDPMITDPNLRSMPPLVSQAANIWSADQGKGVTVAVLDSGIAPSPDLPNAAFGVDIVTGTTALGDPGGHGTHVAGIIAGTGAQFIGKYKGIAPAARVLSVKVTNDTGSATYASLIKGLQWVVANRKAQNIRVLNLSVGAKVARSYKNDPLAAAVELAWFSGIVVVTSAGNDGALGASTITVPGSDPYVITVGANNDKDSTAVTDDLIPTWSSRGPTAYDLLPKPDVVASGNRIVSLRSAGSYLERMLGLTRVVDTNYYRLSGTSMAAPVVAGVAALILSANPALTPNQVKYILKATAKPLSPLYDANSQGAGQVDALAAFQMARAGVSDQANKGIRPSDVFARSILTLARGAPVSWRDPAYLGRNWSTWDWTSGTWDNGTWDNLVWENLDWTNATWTSATWEGLTGWSNGTWSSGTWDSGMWDNGTWDSATWDSGAWVSGAWQNVFDDDAE